MAAGIGPQLKAARERLGITTVEVAKRLHMRAMFVDALEREEWTTIGEPVYVRGFLRNYARAVGLDPAGVVEPFNECDFARVPRDESIALLTSDLTRHRFRYPWLLAAMSAIAVLLVVKVVWTMAAPSAVGHGELRPQPAAAMTSPAQAAAIGALAAAKPQNESGVNLRLELTQSCWLSVTVDGRRVVYQTLPAGTVKDFHGVREISLRAGNAGGVVATIDGQPLGTLGSPGQVQDRIFAVRMPANGQNGLHE